MYLSVYPEHTYSNLETGLELTYIYSGFRHIPARSSEELGDSGFRLESEEWRWLRLLGSDSASRFRRKIDEWWGLKWLHSDISFRLEGNWWLVTSDGGFRLESDKWGWLRWGPLESRLAPPIHGALLSSTYSLWTSGPRKVGGTHSWIVYTKLGSGKRKPSCVKYN